MDLGAALNTHPRPPRGLTELCVASSCPQPPSRSAWHTPPPEDHVARPLRSWVTCFIRTPCPPPQQCLSPQHFLRSDALSILLISRPPREQNVHSQGRDLWAGLCEQAQGNPDYRAAGTACRESSQALPRITRFPKQPEMRPARSCACLLPLGRKGDFLSAQQQAQPMEHAAAQQMRSHRHPELLLS